MMFLELLKRSRPKIEMILGLILSLPALTPSCVGDDRCSEGQIFFDDKCWEAPEDAGSDTDTDADDSGTGQDAGDDMPTCLGDPCSGPDEGCEGCEADYCAWDPIGQEGACTVKDCATAPDNCPAGYRCCKFTESLSLPDFCMPEADWQEQYDNGICVD